MRSTTKVPGVSKEQQEQGKQPKTQVKRKRGRQRKKSKIQKEAEKMVKKFFGPEEEIEEHTLLVEEDTHGGTYPQLPTQPLQQSGSGNAPVIAEQPSKPPQAPGKEEIKEEIMEVGDGMEQQKESHSGNGQCKEPQEEQQEDEMEGGNGGDKEGQEQVDHPRQPLEGEILETEEEHHPNWRRKLTYIGYNEEYPKTNEEHLKFFQQEKKCMAVKTKDLVTKKPQYTRRMMHSGMTHTPQKR